MASATTNRPNILKPRSCVATASAATPRPTEPMAASSDQPMSPPKPPIRRTAVTRLLLGYAGTRRRLSCGYGGRSRRRSARRSSVRAVRPQNGGHGAGQDDQVEGDRPVLDVAQVEADALFPRQVRTAAHLPQAGQSRLDEEPPVHIFGVPLDLGRDGRAWADQ